MTRGEYIALLVSSGVTAFVLGLLLASFGPEAMIRGTVLITMGAAAWIIVEDEKDKP